MPASGPCCFPLCTSDAPHAKDCKSCGQLHHHFCFTTFSFKYQIGDLDNTNSLCWKCVVDKATGDGEWNGCVEEELATAAAQSGGQRLYPRAAAPPPSQNTHRNIVHVAFDSVAAQPTDEDEEPAGVDLLFDGSPSPLVMHSHALLSSASPSNQVHGSAVFGPVPRLPDDIFRNGGEPQAESTPSAAGAEEADAEAATLPGAVARDAAAATAAMLLQLGAVPAPAPAAANFPEAAAAPAAPSAAALAPAAAGAAALAPAAADAAPAADAAALAPAAADAAVPAPAPAAAAAPAAPSAAALAPAAAGAAPAPAAALAPQPQGPREEGYALARATWTTWSSNSITTGCRVQSHASHAYGLATDDQGTVAWDPSSPADTIMLLCEEPVAQLANVAKEPAAIGKVLRLVYSTRGARSQPIGALLSPFVEDEEWQFFAGCALRLCLDVSHRACTDAI
jgi:hypothetical protein